MKETAKNKTLPQKMLNGSLTYMKRNAGILIGFAILCVITSVASPIFLSGRNLMNVLRQTTTNLYLACGMTMILIAGGIDLSVGSVIAVIGVLGGTLINLSLPLPVVVIACLLIGALFGLINGGIIANTTLPPFIVTFAMMSILRGLAYVYTNGVTVRINDPGYIAMGTGYLGIVPLPVIYLLMILIIVYIIMSKTRLGRHMYATGGNEKAAQFSGINIKRVRLFVYIFSGVMAAVAGLMLSSRSYSGNPIEGQGAEMDAITACVLGGVSFSGGSGYIGGTIIGALIIGFLNNSLNLIGISSFWQTTLKGVIILAAVYIDYLKNLKKSSNA
ncbi:ABC transporter permease [Caproicibacter sp.]|uniref:ABC transporter permease n=1 Tax=Caproicibacter sp. TaxID=2814884 RepID=UPI003989E4B4